VYSSRSRNLLAETRTFRTRGGKRRVRNVEEMIGDVVTWSARRTLRGKVLSGREAALAFVQGASTGQEDNAIKDAVYLRARLVDRRDHRRGVVRVVREGVQDRDDFGGRDRIEAWKKSKKKGEMGLCETH
jgi:hypothetical protein